MYENLYSSPLMDMGWLFGLVLVILIYPLLKVVLGEDTAGQIVLFLLKVIMAVVIGGSVVGLFMLLFNF
jgi:hypothetical protein